METEPKIPKVAYEERYRCGNCSRLHEDEYDAEDCCRPETRTVFVCLTCKKEFSEYKEKDAAVCHPINTPASKCLCGTALLPEDREPSLLLGSLIWCRECREQIEAGVPAPQAWQNTFARRAGIAA